MITTEVEPALHWTCRTCGLEWIDTGRGFPGSRYSECLRCGADAGEGADTRPALHQPPAFPPRTRRFAPPR